MLVIKKIKQTNEEIEKTKFKKLVEHFNKLAKSLKSKYRIKIKYYYPFLIQGFWFVENYSNQIYYNENKNIFSFYDDLDESILEEIKVILEEIPEKFEVEQIEGEVENEKI